MKRTALLSALALLLALLFSLAIAEEMEPETFTSGDYEYILLPDGTAEITKYNGGAEELPIPDTLDGKKVTSIGRKTFFLCSSLTSVTIPDSVTRIGDSVFSWCFRLTSVTIPESVTSIGENPFSYCYKLTNIRISPEHPALAVIDGVLFHKPEKCLVCYLCAKTDSSYTIPQGIKNIGDSAFYECDSLTSVTIPDSVTSIGDSAFYNCSNLTSVTIPDSVTSIGILAFIECSSLTSISIPDSVTSIGPYAFYSCFNLKKVTIPDSVTSIGEYAFYKCDNTTFTVSRDSYAAQYCKENNLNYTYPDSLDWLNN